MEAKGVDIGKLAAVLAVAFVLFFGYIACTEAAPVGFADVELKLKPPIERDWCLNPIGETEQSIFDKGLVCEEWQVLASEEISHYTISSGGQLVGTVQHVVNYVDYIFADVFMTYGTHTLVAVTHDTNGLTSKEKIFVIDVVMPTGDPKSLIEFSAKQKPLPVVP